jgi:hypothetical protein
MAAMYESATGETAYRALIRERDAAGIRCTPEEQAGPDATLCEKCNRMTRHQHCRICMACGDDLDRAIASESAKEGSGDG